MLSRERMREVVLEHVEAENVNDPGRVLATYSRENPVFEDVPAGVRYAGGENIVGNYRHLWDGFPDLRREITRWTFGEDAVVIELTLSGKHEGSSGAARQRLKEPARHRPLPVRRGGPHPAGDSLLRRADVHAAAGHRARHVKVTAEVSSSLTRYGDRAVIGDTTRKAGHCCRGVRR